MNDLIISAQHSWLCLDLRFLRKEAPALFECADSTRVYFRSFLPHNQKCRFDVAAHRSFRPNDSMFDDILPRFKRVDGVSISYLL